MNTPSASLSLSLAVTLAVLAACGSKTPAEQRSVVDTVAAPTASLADVAPGTVGPTTPLPQSADVPTKALPTLATRAAGEQVLLWHPYRGAEREGLEQALQAYNKKAKVPVVAHAIPGDLVGSKLARVVPKRQGPDLVIAPHTAVNAWRAADLISPINPTVNTGTQDAYVAGAAKAFAGGGRQFGLPLTAKPVVMVCNAALVPEFPASVEALLARASKSKVPSLLYPVADPYFHSVWVHRHGGTISDGGLPTVTGRGHLEALSFAHKHFATKTPMSAQEVLNQFNRNKVRCMLAGVWTAPEVASSIKTFIGPIPPLNGATVRPFVQFEGVLLTRSSTRRTAAVAAARFLAGPAGAILRRDHGKQPVAHKDTATADPSPWGRASLAQLSGAVALPVVGGSGRHPFWPLTGAMLQSVLTGAATPTADTLEKLQRRIDGAEPKVTP